MPLFNLHMSLVDAYNGKYNKRFQIDAVDFPTALGNAQTFVTAYQDVSFGAIEKYTVGQEVLEGNTPTAGANKDEGLTFNMDLGAGKSAPLKIPAPDKSAVQADRSVLLGDANISVLLAFWTSGIMLISDGETAIGVNSGVLDK